MAILARFGNPADPELFRIVGRHEEFTLFAAIALAYTADDPIAEWLSLLRTVTGWGRIELVELLLRDPRPDVCAVLLRERSPNGLTDLYTALPVATACRLHEVLGAVPADPALLQGAAGIISTLVECALRGGPAGDVFDYPEGGPAIERFLELFAARARTLEDFLVVDAIRQFSAHEHPAEKLQAGGWDRERLRQAQAVCERIVGQPVWRPLAETALASADQAERGLGYEVAKRLGLPLHDYIVARLEADPLDSGMWFELVYGANEARIEEALGLAARLLDVEAIAAGPAEELGLGPEFVLDTCVGYLLQELARFPGKGWSVIRPALRSRVVRNRALALHALHAWPPSQLTGEIKDALGACLHDPDEDVRHTCAELLRR